MNPPRDALLLGHPIIAVPVMLSTIGVFCAGFLDYSWWVLGLVLLWPAGVVARANTTRKAYYDWKRAWEGMAEPAPRTQPGGGKPARWRPWLGAFLLGGVALYCLAHADEPLFAVAFVWLALAVPVAGFIVWIARRMMNGPARHKDKHAPVTVCVARPLLSVPSLKDAYRAMPEHCLTVLGIGRR